MARWAELLGREWLPAPIFASVSEAFRPSIARIGVSHSPIHAGATQHGDGRRGLRGMGGLCAADAGLCLDDTTRVGWAYRTNNGSS